VDLNCAAIPDTLLEAELFGFERGAFTDARQAKPGLFQAAHHGTLFLDEIGLLPEGLQAKLLKVLEERSVRRLGSTRREPVDVWVISATSEDLPGAIRTRRFREDLYHRLAVVTLALPPLRERGEDVIRLAEHFLSLACEDYGLPGKTLANDAQTALCAYGWPGNVRELGNLMERVALLADELTVTAAMLGLPRVVNSTAADERRAALETEAAAERSRLLEALHGTTWNISRAAARLGIPRTTLRYRMEKLGLGPAAGELVERAAPAGVGAATGGADEQDGPDTPRREGGSSGSRLTSEATPPEASEGPQRSTVVRWERRRVTLLRVRLASESGETDASEASRVMAAVLEKVRSFGGHVDELSVLGLLAAFGLEPVDDAPRLAAYTALAIEKVVARARRDDPARASVIVAIHSDRLLVGRHDAGAVLDADAKREARAALDALMDRAEPGMMVATAPAATLLARRFEVVPMAPASGMGSYFRLIGPAEPRRGLTGFVGREAEFALLRDRLEQARLGEGQIVTIIGEAGIGKSRLLRELRHQVADVTMWMEGQAIPLGRAIPFQPLTDLLRRTFQLDEGDARGAVADKIEQYVLSLGADLQPTVPLLRYLLVGDSEDAAVLTMDPNVRRTRIFDATQALLLRLATRRPLVVVCEDAHWIDQATEDLLGLLAESLTTARILLIVTARPGYVPPFGDRTNCTRLPLTALSTAESLEVARGLLDAMELPRDLQGFIAGRAEGNPFFIEEIVRSLQEIGAVRRAEDRLVLTHPLNEVALPDTIQDVIQTRMDRLEEPARQVLQIASALGKDVPFVLLNAIADMPEENLQGLLGRLRAAEFLYETRHFQEIEYTFKHALTHDVVYMSLALEQRRTLHARIVAAVEGVYRERPEDQTERLAHHAVHGELWEKAVRYLRQAGIRAFDRSANQEAVAHFEAALDALTRLPGTPETIRQGIDLRFDLRNALFPLTQLDRISVCLQEAEQLARRLDDRRRMGWVAAYMSSHLWMIGRSGDMRGVAETIVETAEALDDLPLRIAGNAYLGAACLATGDYRTGEQFLRANLALLDRDLGRQRLGLTVFPAVNARARLAWSLAERGEFAEGARLGEDAVRMAEALDHPFSLVTACTLLGYLYRVRGEWGRAQPVIERALAVCREWGVTLWAPVLTGSLGAVYTWSGDVGRGLSATQDALAQYDASGVGFFHTLVTTHLGEAYLAASRIDDAFTRAEQALALSRQRGERSCEAWALRLLGETAASRCRAPDVASAREYYRRALELASELGMRPLVAHCHRGLGALPGQGQDRPGAGGHLMTARALYEDMGMRYWVPQVEAELSEMGKSG
jgi:transcriptional regulator with AAA-type ATPase domain/tetratricopeptide (TPR) repeat protein